MQRAYPQSRDERPQEVRDEFRSPGKIRMGLIGLTLFLASGIAFLALGDLPHSSSQASVPHSLPAAGEKMTQSAQAFLGTLNDEQKASVVLPYDTPKRVEWHFIPKAERKGLQVHDMTDVQRDAAYHLLRESLSAAGYQKARQIMKLEGLLHQLEQARGGGGNIRDPLRYYFTLFGDVSQDGRWGLSIEGHHLSLNFVVESNQVVSITPHSFDTNPAEVKEAVGDFPKGMRVISEAETRAFDLLNALTPAQQSKAIIAAQAIREVRAAGEAQPPQTAPEGIAYTDLDNDQQATLRAILQSYADNMAPDVAARKIAEIEEHGGYEKLFFAWAGAKQEGEGHYYRIQGPTVLIEFVNTQPDAAGNPANHIHTVWRDPRGDFGIPVNE